MAESNASASAARQREVGLVLLRVLGFNLAVAGAKLVLGYSTGAVSVISDGFHSLTDSASNIMGLIGLRAARKPPDEDHPHGHRKYETLAAAGIFVFLLFVVVEVLRSAISRLSGEAPARVTSLSFVVMLATLGINVLVVRYESARGRALRSELLMADAMHTKSDVLSCHGRAPVSLAAIRLGYPSWIRLARCSSRSSSRGRAWKSPARRRRSWPTASCWTKKASAASS